MHGAPPKASFNVVGGEKEAQIPACVLAGFGKRVRQCTPQLDQVLLGTLPCSTRDGHHHQDLAISPIHLQLGVFQGDPLSVLVFNTVMNTMVDTITKEHSALGYRSDASQSRTNLLQYADDTSLLADGPSSCQTLLTVIEAWLSWSGMKANVPKCVCLAIQASTAKPYDPKLTLDGQQIPFIGDTTFHFLGALVNISGTNTPREDLCEKLTTLLQKVDATLLSRQQKLLLYKVDLGPLYLRPPHLLAAEHPAANRHQVPQEVEWSSQVS